MFRNVDVKLLYAVQKQNFLSRLKVSPIHLSSSQYFLSRKLEPRAAEFIDVVEVWVMTNEVADGGKSGDLLLLLLTRETEAEERVEVHPQSLRVGVRAYYRLIKADDPLLAYGATRPENINSLDWAMTASYLSSKEQYGNTLECCTLLTYFSVLNEMN